MWQRKRDGDDCRTNREEEEEDNKCVTWNENTFHTASNIKYYLLLTDLLSTYKYIKLGFSFDSKQYVKNIYIYCKQWKWSSAEIPLRELSANMNDNNNNNKYRQLRARILCGLRPRAAFCGRQRVFGPFTCSASPVCCAFTKTAHTQTHTATEGPKMTAKTRIIWPLAVF